jgi:hypothetical protein
LYIERTTATSGSRQEPDGATVRQLLKRFRLGRLPLATAGTAAVLVGSYPLLFIAALLPNGHDDRLTGSWLFLAVAVAGYAAELIAPGVAKYTVDLLNWLQVGTAVRFVFREAALIVLLARVLNADAKQFAVFTLGVMSLHGLRALYSALAIYVVQRRRLPVVTRNIDLSELRIPDPAPRVLTLNHSWKMLFLDVPALAGGLVADLADDFTWSLAGIAIAIAVGIAGCAGIAPYARRNKHLGDKDRVLRVVNDQAREHAPQVALYFSGAPDTAYQVNMWLETLARLDRPAVIIMRERSLVPLLGRTGLPVVCIDGSADLMNFSLPSVRVALYPSNTGKNIHMLRSRSMAHVFVGHGDSDKAASSNPYTKVYDEVWVAGQAGRDRYLRAGVGVRDEDIVEVGRPQLASLSQASEGTADPLRTVLYAPTWEGWDAADPTQTSLILMGPQIVRALLDSAPLRVLYKPHPLTGTRDPRAARAHEKIAAMIADANQARGMTHGSPAGSDPAGATSSAGAAAAAELARIEGQLLKLAGGAQATRGESGVMWPDYAVLSRDGQPDPQAEEEWRRLEAAWRRLYWSSEGGPRHRVITGPRPTVYECFNQSDLLISDISSVVSDFIATGKPYLVTNPGGLAEDDFRVKFPSAGAAYLIGPDCAGLAVIGALAAGDGDDDPLAEERRQLKRYLLGPDSPDAQTRFNEAAARLAERAMHPVASQAADAPFGSPAAAEPVEAANAQ